MNEAETIATWDVLKEFGFIPDAAVYSDDGPGLSFDFSNFKLSASRGLILRFARVVAFSGVLTTKRTATEVSFEMGLRVESREQCAAWIAWHLDRAAGIFVPTREVGWLIEGRRNKTLLPWVIDRARREQEEQAYRTRPWCTVDREWLKVALKSLAEELLEVGDDSLVTFGFDGRVLSMRCIGREMVVGAEGDPWPASYTLPAGKLRNLPKRLLRRQVDISVWEGTLQIDRCRYDGITDADNPGKANPAL